MNILIVAATALEIAPLEAMLQNSWTKTGEGNYERADHTVRVLITGIGGVATAFSLGVVFAGFQPDLVINAGIAGAIDRDIALGSVVQVISEQFADLGSEQADGSFTDLFDNGLQQADQAPFSNKKLFDPRGQMAHFLPVVHGISSNKVSGTEDTIGQLKTLYPEAQVESMEGAAFFYACLLAETPFIAIRAISNYVEPRNKANWKIKEAVTALNTVTAQIIEALTGEQ